MRKTKTIEINDRKITVKELRVKDIRKVLDTAEQLEENPLIQAGELLPLVTDLKIEELEEMAPSELKILWEAFREVNADFLAFAGRLGIGGTLEKLLRESLKDSFAGLLNEDTAEPGSTASATS